MNEESAKRVHLPSERKSVTHKFTLIGADHVVEHDADGKLVEKVADIDGYLTAGVYDDGRLGEIFLSLGKHGGPWKVFECLMVAVSIGLQYGIPLDVFIDKFEHMSFEPSGVTRNPEIPMVKSIPDYIFRWLKTRFPGGISTDMSEEKDGAS